jgi:hypothetical protein
MPNVQQAMAEPVIASQASGQMIAAFGSFGSLLAPASMECALSGIPDIRISSKNRQLAISSSHVVRRQSGA